MRQFLILLFLLGWCCLNAQGIDSDIIKVQNRMDTILKFSAEVKIDVDISFINIPKKSARIEYTKNEDTKVFSEELLTELINYQGVNLMGEILRLGIQRLMELDRDEHIGIGSYERGEECRWQRNGYKSRQLYSRICTLVLRVP